MIYIIFGVIHQIPHPEQRKLGTANAEDIIEFCKLVLGITNTRNIPFLFDHDFNKPMGKVITGFFHPITMEACAMVTLDTSLPWGKFGFERFIEGTFTSLSTGGPSIARYCTKRQMMVHSFPCLNEISLVDIPRRPKSDVLYMIGREYIGITERIYNNIIRIPRWYRHNMDNFVDSLLDRMAKTGDDPALRQEIKEVFGHAFQFQKLKENNIVEASEISEDMKNTMTMNGYSEDEIKSVENFIKQSSVDMNPAELKVWRTINKAINQTKDLHGTKQKVAELEKQLEEANKENEKVRNVKRKFDEEPENTIPRVNDENKENKRPKMMSSEKKSGLLYDFQQAMSNDPGYVHNVPN